MSGHFFRAEPVTAKQTRFWEVDLLRGFAFILMVIYHGAFDLAVFGGWPIGVTSGAWRAFADFIASLFLFVSGVSLVLARSRAGQDTRSYWWQVLRRSSRLAAAAALVTIVTWVISPRDVVLFGILHLILLSSLVALPLLRLGLWNLPIAAVAWLLGLLLARLPGNPWLFWVGLVPADYRSFDFRPFLPWFAVVLLGVSAGSWLYSGGGRRWAFPSWERLFPISIVIWLGRHSLMLYLIHQPVLVVLLAVLGLLDVGRLIG
ncbi:DUF1624 domain-containing protein [Thermomicrobium sp. CFH 73360]|uniref:heparan-alpha-glucosaminide N-acetyltransferase n=1 Tax=Thermomicrobium sp. CFH 73360 TaxID=2951987 RepID=UPI00207678C1|nr:heparan-alpha-glucosaminide N-acetyltransferase [Thermomicrobium sp. CFH 73360]MCM8744974.1 DUF1624 domain-containing protein [Thermomicrobium sp. CFH 73360]